MEKLAGEVLLFYHLASPSSPDSDSHIISIILNLRYILKDKNFICLNNFSRSTSIYVYQQKEYYSVGEKDNQEK